MTTIVLSFLIMLLVVAGMAVGVIFGRRPITGSCGGMKALGMDVSCEICGGDPARCETAGKGRPERRSSVSALFYRADD
ncbi:MAG: (Na+)-NQR maturation NqrM [Pseudomonadales bacterium]